MPVKQSGTQCYKDAAFHPVPSPDDDFPRSLLTFLVSVLPSLSTFKYLSGCLFICSIHTEHLLRKDPELGDTGNTKVSKRLALYSMMFLSRMHKP